MKRRFILVAMPYKQNHETHFPLGHGSLLVALQQQHIGVKVCHIISSVNDNFSIDSLIRQIMMAAKDIPHELVDLGIGVFVWNDRHIKDLLHCLRSRGFRGRIILGGPQISFAGTGLENIYPEADAFVRGYAEVALPALAQNDERPYIKGVHYKGDKDLCEQTNAMLPDMPSPWLGTIDMLGQQSSVRWETQRGCNFNCTFCQHRQPDARIPVQTIAYSRIKLEIEMFCKANVKRISVLDPFFNRDPAHASHVLQQFIKLGFKGKLSLQCRFEMVDDRFLDIAQQLDVCMEFGLQSIHKREYLAIKRANDMKKVAQVLHKIRGRKISHEVSVIYGLPEQTLESFQATVDWCLGERIEVIKAFPLLLLRGTELEQQRKQWALKEKAGELPMVYSSNSFSTNDWEEMDRIANALKKTEGNHPTCIHDLTRI